MSSYSRRVKCPDCGAEPGARCLDAQADRVDWVHTTRRFASLNLEPERLVARLESAESRLAAIEGILIDAGLRKEDRP